MAGTRDRQDAGVRAFVAIAVVLVGAIATFMVLGTQVSDVLSTVGSSIGGGQVVAGDQSGDDTSGNGSGGGVVAAAPRDDLLIIKTGALTLEVDAIDGAVRSATTAIDGLGGYAAGSQRSGAGEDARATVTFRVPAARWDEAMNAMRGLASEVLAEESKTEDVTSEVVDLGARIRNLQATERALQSIMDRATVIRDVLSVQAELTTVRGGIEQLSAQKAHLEEQAAFSTLTATFVLKPAPVLAEQQDRFDPASQVDAASASLVGVLQGVATAGIWFGIVWLPILLTLATIAVVGLLVARRFRRSSALEPVGN